MDILIDSINEMKAFITDKNFNSALEILKCSIPSTFDYQLSKSYLFIFA